MTDDDTTLTKDRWRAHLIDDPRNIITLLIYSRPIVDNQVHHNVCVPVGIGSNKARQIMMFVHYLKFNLLDYQLS